MNPRVGSPQSRPPGADESQEDLLPSTTSHKSGRDRFTALEATRARLRQQLASTDPEVSAVAADNEAYDREVADAERAAADLAARRLLRYSLGTCCRRTCNINISILAIRH